MSCQACTEFQDSEKTTFFRWKNANVEIRACAEHTREIFRALKDHLKKALDIGEPE